MRTSRSASVLLAPVAALVLAAVPASAHVSVTGPSARQGGTAVLTFRVPTEREVATTSVRVLFPEEARLTEVTPAPQRGWSVALTRDSGRVTALTWTATDGGIAPEQAARFTVRVGPLPYVDRMVLRTLQTYADGEIVRWIETGAGAEHPAPVLVLAKASAPSPSASASPTAVPAPPRSQDDDSGAGPLVAGGAALLAVLVGAVMVLLRRKRRA